MSSSFYTKSEAAGMRQFTIGDPPVEEAHPANSPVIPRQLSPEERQELNRLRQENTSPRITDHAKQRIEILANIGRLSKEVEAEGVVFSMRTLKSKETREATLPMFQCTNDIDAGFEIRRQSLARSIYAIDGQDFDLVVGGKDIERKLAVIDNLEEATVITLYNAHLALKTEATNKFAPKTEADLKEVREDLKK